MESGEMCADTRAVIDIGSNSIKLRVIRREENDEGKGEMRVLIDRTELVRMGRGLDSGTIGEAAMRQGVESVQRMVRAAEDVEAVKPRVVGTMALRTACNAEDFIRQVRERTGITVEVLSEEQEARLAWLGAVRSLGVTGGDVAVLDIGGGSTQLIVSADSRITRCESVPIGTVNLTEQFFTSDPVEPGMVKKAVRYIRDAFAFDRAAVPDISVIGLGGGVLALASVKQKFPSFVPGKLNGTFLTRADIAAQRELYASMPLAERMKIAALPPKRADIALAGACIAQCSLEVLRADAFRVSINGLRHGLLLEMFEL
jgi:exopolyphosphatase/guanosine-5'-triphosphate,3'-diphosphate pyrophosphatase